jgi:enamine deaminase RidA (YjgF/YER057c/UK114 family)
LGGKLVPKEDRQAVVLDPLYRVPGSAHAIRVGDLVYTAGVVALGPDGKVTSKGDIRGQARRVYDDLVRILQAAGAELTDAVKVNYYVAPQATSAAERMALHEVHHHYLPSMRCAGLGISLPLMERDLLVQIEVIARIGVDRRPITNVPEAMAAPGWAHGVQVGTTLYAGAQFPIIERDVDVLRSTPGTISIKGGLGDQAVISYRNLGAVLKAAGMNWDHVLQVHNFMTQRRLAIPELQAARTQFLTLGRFLSTSVACESEHPDWPMKDWQIGLDMEADSGPRTHVDVKGVWGNPKGPHAIRSGNVLRMHGQVARKLEGRTLYEGDGAKQSELVFENLDKILRAAGTDWSHVLLIRNFCKSRDDIAKLRRVRAKWMPADSYATTDIVADFFDPLLLVEVEIVATVP